MNSDAASLTNNIGFEFLGSYLGDDLESSLRAALAGGAIFSEGDDPLVIFRKTLASSIVGIETNRRGKLFQEFLLRGPYDDSGKIPAELATHYLSDDDTASAITFIYSHMVNSFKGAITELLATGTCLHLMQNLQGHGRIPANARLYVGDSIGVHRPVGKGYLKGGDQYILIQNGDSGENAGIVLAGITEIKSYVPSRRQLREQLDRHFRRAKFGLRVNGVDYPKRAVKVGYGPNHRFFRIAVVPSTWKLPRTFWFKKLETGRALHVEQAKPNRVDEITHVGENEWRITLKWSMEALANAAFEMTFWYMGKVGEIIYGKSTPKSWEEMKPSDAGRNAAKMMLYYALLRCRTNREEQRAIALYNSYCFGYALGMNFKNVKGRREMLWIEDLDEILMTGKTTSECMIR